MVVVTGNIPTIHGNATPVFAETPDIIEARVVVSAGGVKLTVNADNQEERVLDTTRGREFSENPEGSNWDVKVEYTAGPLTFSAQTDEVSAWKVLGSYDLGGGLKIEGGARDRGTLRQFTRTSSVAADGTPDVYCANTRGSRHQRYSCLPRCRDDILIYLKFIVEKGDYPRSSQFY